MNQSATLKTSISVVQKLVFLRLSKIKLAYPNSPAMKSVPHGDLSVPVSPTNCKEPSILYEEEDCLESPSRSSGPSYMPQSYQEPYPIEQSELNDLVCYKFVKATNRTFGIKSAAMAAMEFSG
jgi:hypothetical protein